MSVVYIYGLIDSRNDNIFYVGFTQYLKKRYNVHLNVNGNRREKNLYKDNIIRKILNVGLKPEMIILDSCEKLFNYDLNIYEHERLEINYIEKFKENGINLSNLTIGGFYWFYKNNIPKIINKYNGRYSTMVKPISQYDLNNNLITDFISISDAARQLKISVSGIVVNLKNHTKTYNGFIFKYKNNDKK